MWLGVGERRPPCDSPECLLDRRNFRRYVRLMYRLLSPSPLVVAVLAACLMAANAGAQGRPVLQLDPQDGDRGVLPWDRGASGLRQRLLELGTVASVMETTAHPDDEQAGLLTNLSRGTGARTALSVLNRGEGGANATGDELFDGLGLIRTQELLLAGRYYGLDDIYFTSAADYGYSKTMAEAARSWDTTAILRDMVRIIRRNQPLVVISRWYGAERDGHGHHQLAGALTPSAVDAAADSTRFPEQLHVEGLRPWKVLRLFRSNVPSGLTAHVTIDASRFDPWLGMTYDDLGAEGYVRQASQTGGRRGGGDPRVQRLEQLRGRRPSSPNDIFSSLDLSVGHLFTLTGERQAPGVAQDLLVVQRAADISLSTFNPAEPWRSVDQLRVGLHALRRVLARTGSSAPRARFMLEVKERQFERAIVAALAIDASAIAVSGFGDGRPVTPGESLTVELTVRHGAPVTLRLSRSRLESVSGWVTPAPSSAEVARGVAWRDTVRILVPSEAPPDRPAFTRSSIASAQYAWRNGVPSHEALPIPTLVCEFVLDVGGEPVTFRRTVRSRRSYALDGTSSPPLVVVPPVSLRLVPGVRVVHGDSATQLSVAVEVTGNAPSGVTADIALQAPAATAARAVQRAQLAFGERRTIPFSLTMPAGVDSLVVRATARVKDRVWTDQLNVLSHAGLEPAYLYATPATIVRRIDVRLREGLKVGYVMGVGDLVPEAIAELGAEVSLLDAAAVAAGDFSSFDAVVIGTRAYSVRPELAGAAAALRRYAENGGEVVVLYQTPDANLATSAPFYVELPNDAEEISEEDAPVQLLDAAAPLLTSPNRITSSDFDGWVEQRGSKFLRQWGPEFTPLIESHDSGQAPQRGIWVTADVGAGRWTYVSLALHRQLPFGVPGAYRILANLLSRR